MGTLNTVVRNAMLDVIPDADAPAGINYIELEPDLDLGRHAISWSGASNGVLEQDGTITIEADLEQEQGDVEITGFKFYSLDDSVSSNGSGEFTEPLTVEGGFTYTFNISGIQIELPE